MQNTIELLNAIFDHSSENIILISPEHKILAANKTIQNTHFSLFGRKLEVGGDYRNYISLNSLESYLNLFEKTLNGEEIVFQHETKTDDFSIWFEHNLKPVYNENQELLGIMLTSKNIDKQKQAELKAEYLDDTLNSIFEHSTESILVIDKNYIILNFNAAAFQRLKNGLGKELRFGADFRDYIYNSTNDQFDEMFEKALQGESTAKEIQAVTSENKTVWFEAKTQPVYYKNGELLGVSIFSNHITEKKLAEIALKESEERFRKIIDSAPMPIIITDESMNITLANPETEKVFGYNPEELLGQNISMLIPERYRTIHRDYESDYIQNPVYYVKENRFVSALTKNGNEISISANLNSFTINGKNQIVTIIQDVTQRIQHEKQIEDQLSRLKAIAWQQSHGIRRPLTNIMSIHNLFQTGYEFGEKDKNQYLDYLFQSAKELDHVINTIVDHTQDI